MINAAAIVVMKAIWGQGHGRERNCELGSPMGLSRVLRGGRQVTIQLANCPQLGSQALPLNFTAVAVKTGA